MTFRVNLTCISSLGWVTSVCLFLFLCLVLGQAQAQIELRDGSYVIRNIRSEAKAQSSVEASEIAVRNAQMIGLRELFSRIVPKAHRNRIKVPTNSELDQMLLRHFDHDTRSSVTSYRLVTDLEFDKRAVISYLNASVVPFVDQPPQQLLIVPQLITAQGEAKVLERDNRWARAWSNWLDGNSVVWHLPEDNAENAELLSQSLLEFRNVEEVAANQGLSGAYIARITEKIGANGEVVELSMQALRVGDALGPPRLDESGMLGDELTGTSAADLYNRFATALTNAVTDEWLDQGPVELAKPTSITIVVLGISVEDWAILARQLEATATVVSARFIQTRQGVLDVGVDFRGNLLALQEQFSTLGFQFEAYSLINQPEIIGFVLLPTQLSLPSSISVLDLRQIRLTN